MIKILVWNEVRMFLQKRLLLWLFIAVNIFWIAGLCISIHEYKLEDRTRNAYKEKQRQAWIHQFPKNPHMAAHFGTFAFKPANPMSLFDKGISNYSGTFIYLEAHRQNDFICAPAQNSSVFIRMGEFNSSFILQFVLPLFLLTITAGMFHVEKSTGILSFITTNSVSLRTLLYAKLIALSGLVSLILAFLFSFSIIIALLSGISWHTNDLYTLLLLFVCYNLFYIALSSFGLLIASKSTSYKSSFILCCSTWILLFFILPRILTTFSQNTYPLPSNIAFKSAIKKDIENGINGHAHGDREQHIIDSLLAVYHVDSTHKLPVNIDGILLSKGETYSSSVYNQHFNKLHETISMQQDQTRIAAIINPFLAMKNISMSLCNNHIEHEFDFRAKAEAYRSYFVEDLNTNMTLYSKESEFNTYKVQSDTYAKIKDFSYAPFTLIQNAHHSLIDILLLLACIGCIQIVTLTLHK